MSSEMNWSLEYCLYCDRQTAEGAYCSQACRVADLEKSAPSSPVSLHLQSNTSYFNTSRATYNFTPHYQAPAPPTIAYAAQAPSPTGRYYPTNYAPQTQQVSYAYYYTQQPVSATPQQQQQQQQQQQYSYSSQASKRLSSCSSQSSISSCTTGSAAAGSPTASYAAQGQGLTEQAYTQLRDYSNSFDQTRDWKRKATSG